MRDLSRGSVHQMKVSRSNYRQRLRSASLAWNGVQAGRRIGQGLKRRFFGGGSETATKRGKKVTGQTTFQVDSKTLYSRRRAPRRVRSRARKSFQKFTYNLDKTQGMTTSVFNQFRSASTAPTVATTGCQALVGFTMYGTNPSLLASDGNADLWKIFYDYRSGAVLTSTNSSETIRFRAAIMDFQVKNTGEANMFIEVYHVVSRGQMLSDPATDFGNAVDLQLNNSTGTPLTDATSYKITPFDAPTFGSYWYIKSRKRFYITMGNTITWQIRDAKNYVVTGGQVFQGRGIRNVTEGVMIIGYGADVNPSAANASVGIPEGCAFDVSCVKTYHWTASNNSVDSVGLGTGL